MSVATKTEQAEARETLIDPERYGLTRGMTLYMHSVNDAGTMIRVHAIITRSDGKPALFNLTWLIGQAIGYSVRDKEGQRVIHVTGYGFSRQHDIAYALGHALFNDGDAFRYESI